MSHVHACVLAEQLEPVAHSADVQHAAAAIQDPPHCFWFAAHAHCPLAVQVAPVGHSAVVQQLPFAMQPLPHTLKPSLQLMPHWVPSQLALPPAEGAGHALQAVPHALTLLFDKHTPRQSCVPSGHFPVQGASMAMQDPAHALCPDGHFGRHCPALQVALPPLGAAQGSHAPPQDSTAESLAQRLPQGWVPVGQAHVPSLQWPPLEQSPSEQQPPAAMHALPHSRVP